jgi:hypothetical protein
MTQLLVGLLFTPVCAMLAGAIIWLMFRSETLDDAALIRNFVIALVLISGSGWGFLRTDAVRMRIEPVYRIQREIESHPLYATIALHAPSDAEALRKLLETEMAAGMPIEDALRAARPMLWREVKYRSGFADQATRLEYARYVTDTLKEFRNTDPVLCHRIVTQQPLDRAVVLDKFTRENAAAFHETAIKIYESADRGMRREWNPNDKIAEFRTVALEYQAIQEEIEQRYGKDIATLLRSDRIRSAPATSAAELCKARIYQLEAMQKRPKEIASRLTDSVLRS